MTKSSDERITHTLKRQELLRSLFGYDFLTLFETQGEEALYDFLKEQIKDIDLHYFECWPFSVKHTPRNLIQKYCLGSEAWQKMRLFLKGKNTSQKIMLLILWRVQLQSLYNQKYDEGVIQIDNYINALLRGGQLIRKEVGIYVQR